MKAISLMQPWGTLIVGGSKKIETRSWATSYRGVVAIHVSKQIPPEARNLCQDSLFHSHLAKILQKPFVSSSDVPIGAIIGTVEIVDCLPMDDNFPTPGYPELAFGLYAGGRFAWLLRNPVMFANPIPCNGMLGLWEVPAEIAERIERDVCLAEMAVIR